MAVKHSIEEIFDLEHEYVPSYDVTADKVALDFQLSILEQIREDGLTQKDLAERMGITPPTLSTMLRKGANLTIKTMCRIAYGLGCAISSPRLQPLSSKGSYLGLSDQLEKDSVSTVELSGHSATKTSGNYAGGLRAMLLLQQGLSNNHSAQSANASTPGCKCEIPRAA